MIYKYKQYLKALFLFIFLSMGISAYLNNIINSPINISDEPVFIEIQKGMSFNEINKLLITKKIINNPYVFYGYARFTNNATNLKAGEYLLKQGLTIRQLLDKFIKGDVFMHSFTIVEGWTLSQTIEELIKVPELQNKEILNDESIIRSNLGIKETSLEGLFLPETYFFPKNTSASILLSNAYEAMQDVLSIEWQNRSINLPYDSPYEALILASIIEKETALTSERKMISGVFNRRLNQNMRLQTDPTVIYGLGDDFDGNLTRENLKFDTPYNTYTRRGLPPGPISLPGIESINAAINPEPGKSLYFVATGLPDGSHKFSNTNREHQLAVREYLNRRKMNEE